MATNVESFSINVTGETTGEKYPGVFKTKIRLSHRDQLKQDELRRDLLGKNPEAATPRAQNQADVFSTLGVHLVDAPDWFKARGGGLDLEDDNVIGAIYDEIQKIKVEALKKLKADAEAARVQLAKTE